MRESFIQDQQQSNSLDDILEKQIGFGNNQSILLRPLYFLMLIEGCETIVLGLLIPKLGVDWQFGDFQKSLLITMVYLGVSLGSFIQTYSDSFGRYKFLLFDSIVTALFGLISVFCGSFYSFLVTRFFYGIGIGIILPLTATYITQIVPGSKRAYVIAISEIYWSFGCFIACVLGWFLLQGNHWRVLLFIVCLPSFYAIYDIYNNGRQSLRYLWVEKNYQQVIDLLNMFAEGNGKPKIEQEQIRRLMDDQKNMVGNKQIGFRDLINGKYLKSTLTMSLAWISACFIYYGVMLMLPSILARHSELSDNFQYIFLIVISGIEIMASYSSQFIMNSPVFGRKRTIYLCNFLIAFFTLVIILSRQQNQKLLLIAFIGLKYLSSLGFVALYPYSSELYQTKARSTAMGVFSIWGRLSTTLLGMIGISSLSWANGMGLYYIFLAFSLITGYFVYKMPYCTLGRELDT